MSFLCFIPSTKFFNCKQLYFWEFGSIFFCYFFITWTVEVLSRNFLAFFMYKYSKYASGYFSCTFFINNCIYYATGGSARILTEGATISNLSSPNSLSERNASFSQAISTSPIPFSTKVVVEPRAPESNTSTFL